MTQTSVLRAAPPKARIHMMDELRGFAVLCMVFYHAFYSAAYLLGWQWGKVLLSFFMPAEPYFAGLFILISGISSQLSHSNLIRGLKLLAVAVCVTLVTGFFLPDQIIRFGILHLLSCARSQEMLDEECRELELVRQKLLTVQQKEEELEPERRSLGGRLRFYYGWKSRENEERSKENLCLQQVEKERMQEYQRTDRKLERQIQDNATEMGALGNKVRSYDREEEEYNRRYQGNLARNILGEYEPGSLEILLDSQAKELEEKRREKIRKKNEQELGKEQQKVLERTLEDLRSMRIRQEMEQKQQTAVQEHYEEELKVRRVILKYPPEVSCRRLRSTGEIWRRKKIFCRKSIEG